MCVCTNLIKIYNFTFQNTAKQDKLILHCPKNLSHIENLPRTLAQGQKFISNPCPIMTKSSEQALNPKFYHP